MDRSDVMQLVAVRYTEDAIGQRIPAETARDVFCNVASVSASEWFEAGRSGMQAALKVTVFEPDYRGEQIAWWTACGMGFTAPTAPKMRRWNCIWRLRRGYEQ